MKKQGKNILLVAFSFLIFIYSLGTPITAHLCQEEIKDIEIFSLAKECNYETKCEVHKNTDKCEIDHKTCCENESSILTFISFKSVEKTVPLLKFVVIKINVEELLPTQLLNIPSTENSNFFSQTFLRQNFTTKEYISFINIFLC